MGATSKREPLSRAAIVNAAIALADEGGVSALTMRKLAERLGNKVMALYNHVANKDQLLSLMVDAVAAEVDEPSTDDSAITAVRAMAISTRAILVRHPWAAELWQQYLPGPARTRHMENLLHLKGFFVANSTFLLSNSWSFDSFKANISWGLST